MKGAVSAAEANRRFSSVLRDVQGGRTYVVTSHGRPVARIVPFTARDRATAHVRRALFERLRSQAVAHAGRWSRDELYER
jgi:prevent-host-death family protein